MLYKKEKPVFEHFFRVEIVLMARVGHFILSREENELKGRAEITQKKH